MTDEKALVIHQESILPVFGGREMRTGLNAYRELQASIDDAMPDCIMKIGDKAFRKKSYWRAVAVAFHLDVQCMQEERIAQDGGFVWRVTYRATAQSGRHADGDGACASSEKPPRQATEHNVRSHAHTRGYNRAVSNLVGFGEVSAEEVEIEVPQLVAVPRDVAVYDPAKEAAAASARGAIQRQQEAPTPRSQPASGQILHVREVKPKKSKTGTVYYEVYFKERLGTSDRDMASTFDVAVVEAATQAIQTGVAVQAQLYQKDNGYWNVQKLMLLDGE